MFLIKVLKFLYSSSWFGYWGIYCGDGKYNECLTTNHFFNGFIRCQTFVVLHYQRKWKVEYNMGVSSEYGNEKQEYLVSND